MSDHDFNTPPDLLDLIRQLHRRGIGLDPCSNQWSMVKARTTYTEEENGLSRSWRNQGLVFVNPPHSTSPNNIEPWMEKAYEQFIRYPLDRHTDDVLVLLVPAKTDTRWFHRVVVLMAARCFLKGRPNYWHHGQVLPGPGKFASMLVYHGPSTGRFAALFEPLGWVV